MPPKLRIVIYHYNLCTNVDSVEQFGLKLFPFSFVSNAKKLHSSFVRQTNTFSCLKQLNSRHHSPHSVCKPIFCVTHSLFYPKCLSNACRSCFTTFLIGISRDVIVCLFSSSYQLKNQMSKKSNLGTNEKDFEACQHTTKQVAIKLTGKV